MTKTKEKTTDERDKEQAEVQLESITSLIERVKHCQECDGGEDCKLDDKTILNGLGYYYREGDKATEKQRQDYHDEDDARQRISEDPLSAEVIKRYEILLCTGGPACRIVGELDEYGQPETATMQYQDWFKPWTDLNIDSKQEEILLDYAREFYFED